MVVPSHDVQMHNGMNPISSINAHKAQLGSLTISIVVGVICAQSYQLLATHIERLATPDTSVTANLIRVIIFTGLSSLPASWLFLGFSNVNGWLHAHRWAIGAAIVLSATLLDISGSSMGWWSHILDTPHEGLVIGEPRETRGDEYAVSTPFAFAQGYNDYGYFNSLIGNRPADMFIIKDAPVWYITEVFRPMHWGYFLFGSSRGLAFYWSSRQVLMALSSYEFMLLITNGRRRVSVIVATLISFSPAVQWWFAVNNLPEMLIALFLMPVLVQRYVMTQSAILRLSNIALFMQCAGMFLLGFYPPWEIPLFFLLCIVLVCVFWDLRDSIAVTRWDVLNVLWVTCVFVSLIALVMHNSLPAIRAALNTAYPGNRISVGGQMSIQQLFKGSAGLAFPFQAYVGIGNAPESALLIDLFPAGIALALVQFIRNKSKDLMSLLLTIFISVCLIYMIVGFPTWLARFTLFSYSLTGRLLVVVGVANLILLARCVSRCTVDSSNRNQSLVTLLLASSVYGIFIAVVNHIANPQYCRWLIVACLAIIAAMTVFSVFSSGNAVATSITAALTVLGMAISGLAVNPVQYSSAPLTEQPLSHQVKAVQEYEPGIWATDGSAQMSQFLVANGIPTANALQVTPAMNLWSTLDPKGTWRSAYNRYAYVEFTVVPSPVDEPFTVIAPDAISVSLTPEQLDSISVTYVLSSHELDEATYDGYRFVQVGVPSNAWTAYRLEPAL